MLDWYELEILSKHIYIENQWTDIFCAITSDPKF